MTAGCVCRSMTSEDRIVCQECDSEYPWEFDVLVQLKNRCCVGTLTGTVPARDQDLKEVGRFIRLKTGTYWGADASYQAERLNNGDN